MFKSKFNELMKNGENFEIIKDEEALSVEGGKGCRILETCGSFTGGCNYLTGCTTYTATEMP